jgi:hypothetical protein
VRKSAAQQGWQIALEIITPGRHNDACSFINRNAPVISAPNGWHGAARVIHNG